MSNLLRVPNNVTVKIIDGSYWISWQCIEIELNNQEDAQTVIDMLVGESMLEEQVSDLKSLLAQCHTQIPLKVKGKMNSLYSEIHNYLKENI